jgi:hypothetical protein
LKTIAADPVDQHISLMELTSLTFGLDRTVVIVCKNLWVSFVKRASSSVHSFSFLASLSNNFALFPSAEDLVCQA